MKRFERPEDIKVAVVGYGAAFNMGQHHLNGMKRVGMVPVAVADIDPSRLPVAKEDFPGIRTFDSATEMLANCDVDLVGVITPHDTHADLAIECLEAGKHVVTEKPFVITTAEADAVIKTAKEHDVMISVHHNRHWDGCILNAAEKINAGLIGDVIRVEAHSGTYSAPRDWWRASKSISGGVNYDWGAHFLEYALQIIDSDVVEVTGFAKYGCWEPVSPWGKDTVEDDTYTVIRFASGQCMTLLITRIESHPRAGWFDITGTQGSFHFSHQDWHATIQEKGGHVVRHGANPRSESGRFYENIAAHLTSGEPLIITAEWARRNVHIMDLADRSSREGKTLKATYV